MSAITWTGPDIAVNKSSEFWTKSWTKSSTCPSGK